MEIKGKCKKHGSLDATVDYVCVSPTSPSGYRLRCRICIHETRLNTYYRNQEDNIKKSVEWKKNNRNHVNDWQKADRKKNPEKYLKWGKIGRDREGPTRNHKEISRRRGINLESYYEMFEIQEHKCAICKRSERRMGRKGELARLCVDHCHVTQKVRGLLCHDCNSGLGKFQDSAVELRKAAEYLENHE